MAKNAWQKRLLTLTCKPTAVVNRSRFVDGDGNQIAVAATRAAGISMDDADADDVAAGREIGVAVLGVEELEIGAAVAKRALLTSDNVGRGVTAVAGNPVNAIALEAGGAAGDRVPALIIQGPVSA